MREAEMIYRKLFEVCGKINMVEQIKDLYKEMQS